MASCIVCRGHAATLNSCLNGNPNITAQQSLIGKVFQSGGLSINSTEDISLPELLAPVAQCVCIPTFPQQYNDCMTCFNGTGKIPASGNTTFNLEDITAACQIEAQLLANTTVVVPSIGNSTTITTSSAPRKSFNSKKVLVAGLTIVALLAGNL
ncbi:7782_t:CDS:1 [Ambispora gerdemannii]|uniref:7782_t:CDS:1 n=1 Tax=Ambispora gerdemannii TaxID=144530 RepID=A0A9N8UYF2_9GLOM|nr:7782_t:CDS:1 [Ambispora gerdemannii]